MLLYDKQSENYSDLNDNYKILSYFYMDLHFFTKLNLAMFKYLREGVFMVIQPTFLYLYKALNVLCTGHPDL